MVPVVSIERTSSDATITEGGTATFTVTASPTPASALTVRLKVADVQNADFIAPSHQGAQTVTVPTGGSATYMVATQTDSIDEPDGTVTVTVSTGTDYTVSGTDSAASVTVNDNDATTVVLTTPDTTANEGSSTATAQMVLTLGRALRTGERLAVPLAFSGGTRDTDFTLALSGTPTGVAFSGHTVTFSGSSGGSATAATVTLTAEDDADAEDESITVSIPAAHTGSPPNLGATGLSGGATGSRTGNGQIMVTDDDTVGLTFSPASPSVTEGSSGSYTVVLDTQPTATVTVTITSDEAGLTIADTDSVSNGIQNTLTFNPTGANLWSTPQTVTVNAGQDDNTANESVTLTHTAASGDYASVTEALAVTVTDDDTAGLVFSPASVTVTEGGSSTYTVKLATQPSAAVTVTIASDNTDVTTDTDTGTPGNQTTLTFNPTGPAATLWSTARTVTVSAARDETSTTYDKATLTHTALGGDYASVEAELAVTVTDTTVPVITLQVDTDSGTEGNQTTLDEGAGETTVTVSATLPGTTRFQTDQSVRIQLGQQTDSATRGTDYTPVAEVDLIITAGMASGQKTIRLTPIDDDLDEGDETISVSGTLAGTTVTPATLTLTDNDRRGITVAPSALALAESDHSETEDTKENEGQYTMQLMSEPTNEVMIQIVKPADAPFTVEPSSLTFEPGEHWNDPQTVTVTAMTDVMTTPESRMAITHTLAGESDYKENENEIEVGGVMVTVTGTQRTQQTTPRPPSIAAHFEVGSAEVEEDVGPVRVAILLDPPPDSMASLHYTVSGTATAALPGAVFPGEEADYRIEPGDRGTVTAAASGCAEEPTCLSGTITVPADTERVVIPLQIHDDARDEPDETVVLTLDHAEGGPDRLHTHTLTIIDNDVPLITILPGESPVEEGTAVSFLLAADPVPYRDLAVHLALSEHGTYLGEDVARQPAVVFPAQANTATWQGATQDDGVAEADGSVTATVRPGDGYQVGEPSSATVRVTDDERPRSAALAGWLVRFGRSVAEAVIGGVSTRWEAPRTPGLSGTLAGVGLSGDSPREAPLGTDQEGDPDDRGLTVAELLGESEFTWTGETDEQGRTAGWWGRVSSSTFEGAEATFTVDGEVTTGLIGLDVVRGDWLGGVALGVSEGDGTYALDSGETGDMTASLGALIPYGQRHLAPGRTAWALAGAGQGDLTLVPVADPVSRTGIGWRMLAGGLTESLMVAPGDGGFGLSAKTDGLWMQTDSAAVSGLEATRSAITRWRGGLEGTWDQVLWDGARLTPTLEVGLRHDAGDAETGWGVEWGAGLTWMDPVRGLELSLEGRGLVDHQDRAFRTRGVGASLAYDPSPDSELGWSLTVGQTLGDAHSGGMDALFAPGPLSGERGRTGSMDRQWTAEAAYGLPTRGGRFTGSPHVALTVGGTDRTAAMGWRWTPTDRQTDLAVGVTATRTDRPDMAPDHAIVLEATRRW